MALTFLDIVYSRRRKIYAVVILLMVFYVPLLYNLMLPNPTLYDSGRTVNVSCYYSLLGDALPSADHNTPVNNSIFFHETSCTGNLTSRQTCAVESAARAHPDYQIHVLFTAPVTKAALNGPPFSILGMFTNMKLARIHILEYAKRTPMEQVVTDDTLKRSQWRISHTSDVLRYLTLYKLGGIYLDMDVVVAKRLDTLVSNWAARQSKYIVAAGAMAFSRDEVGRKIAMSAAREILINFRGDIWGHNGPGVITRVLKRKCFTTNVTLMSAATCGGFEVYGPEKFYPIEWQNAKEYFLAGKLKNQDAYVYHVWNHLTKDLKVDENSPYADLAKRFCPSTYKLYDTSEEGEERGTSPSKFSGQAT